jgi:ligand-binding sensor domain-containing protein
VRKTEPGREVLAGAGVRQDGWHFLGAADGLTNNEIKNMVQDGRGNLWLATRGLVRFDGEPFTFFTRDAGLPSNEVSAPAVGSENTLWIGTRKGLSRYDGAQWTAPTATSKAAATR